MAGTTSPVLNVDEVVTTNIRMLLARDGVHPKDLDAGVDIPTSTFYRRLKRGGWTVAEVSRLARHFGVTVGSLYDDPRQPTDGYDANLWQGHPLALAA